MNLDIEHRLNLTTAQLRGKRLAVIGKSGSGKTHFMKVALEEWLRGGLPAIVVDPMGQFGRMAQQFPIIVAGSRKTAHFPLNAATAGEVARIVHNERLSVVLDLAGYRGGGDMLILEAFLEGLLDKVDPYDEENPEDLSHLPQFMVMIDEAHLYAPQVGSTPVSSSIFDLAKLGRHKNFTTFVATQRTQAIHNEFLMQANLLAALRLSFSADTKILAETLPLKQKDLTAMMRKLNVGEAVVIGDSDLIGFDEDYLRVQIRQRQFEAAEASGAQDAAPAAERGLNPISPELIERLQSMLNPPEPKPGTAKAGKKPKLEDSPQDDELIAEKEAIIDGLNADVERLTGRVTTLEQERDAAWVQVRLLDEKLKKKKAPAPPQMMMFEAEAVEEDQVTVRERTTTTKTVEREIIGAHVSTRSLQIRQNRQRNKFDDLIRDLIRESLQARLLLDYFLGQSGFVHIEVAARALDYDTTQSQWEARKIMKLGLLRQKEPRSRYWKADVSEFLKREYPDLDAAGLVAHLQQVLTA